MKIFYKLLTLVVIKFQLISYIFSRKNSSSKNALLIAPYRLGDFCMWLPFANGQILFLKEQGYSVTLLISPALIDFSKKVIDADNFSVHSYEKYLAAPVEMMRFATKIGKPKYAIAASVSIERDFFYNDLPLIYSKAKKTYLTSAVDDSPALCCRLSRLMDKLFFHETISVSNYRTRSELDNYYTFTKGMLQKDPQLSQIDLSRLPQNERLTDNEYILIFPTTQDSSRNWDEDNFKELIIHLLDEYSEKIVIAGTNSDYNIGERFAEINRQRIINHCGKSSLPELVSILKTAKLVIGNDSGGLNMAIIAGTSAVAIMGDGVFRFMNVPGKFKSIGLADPECCRQSTPCIAKNCNWQCQFDYINGHFPCINNIKTEDVLDLCSEALEKYKMRVHK